MVGLFLCLRMRRESKESTSGFSRLTPACETQSSGKNGRNTSFSSILVISVTQNGMTQIALTLEIIKQPGSPC